MRRFSGEFCDVSTPGSPSAFAFSYGGRVDHYLPGDANGGDGPLAPLRGARPGMTTEVISMKPEML
jgi:hypothetical protein